MILEMARGEIEAFLLSQKVGRLGCHVGGETYVVPVIYGWDADCFYVLTTEGKKVEMIRENGRVCFEVDEYLPSGGWRSVIAQGVFEELGRKTPRGPCRSSPNAFRPIARPRATPARGGRADRFSRSNDRGHRAKGRGPVVVAGYG